MVMRNEQLCLDGQSFLQGANLGHFLLVSQIHSDLSVLHFWFILLHFLQLLLRFCKAVVYLNNPEPISNNWVEFKRNNKRKPQKISNQASKKVLFFFPPFRIMKFTVFLYRNTCLKMPHETLYSKQTQGICNLICNLSKIKKQPEFPAQIYMKTQ